MIVTEILNHVAQAKARFMTQYAQLNLITSTMQGIVEQIQDLESAVYDLDASRQLANAIGVQLDKLGIIIGAPRGSLSDVNYRLLLLATIAENNSDGRSSTILSIVQSLYDANYVFMKNPNSPTLNSQMPPAFVALGIGGANNAAVSFSQLAQIIQGSLSGGVVLSYLSSFGGTPESTFSMAGPQPWVAGFGDLNDPTVGGGFASLVYSNEQV